MQTYGTYRKVRKIKIAIIKAIIKRSLDLLIKKIKIWLGL
jgi:hypothetical protein